MRSQEHTKESPITTELKVDGCLVSMEVDTGAATSVMSESLFTVLWPGRSLEPTIVRLRSYTKEEIRVVGCCYVDVIHESQSAQNLPVIIVTGYGPCLLGRDWLSHVKQDCRKIHNMPENIALQDVLEKHPAVSRKVWVHCEDSRPRYILTQTLTRSTSELILFLPHSGRRSSRNSNVCKRRALLSLCKYRIGQHQ